ncbi:MAG: YdcF family protein [Pseudomonadota bacterium]
MFVISKIWAILTNPLTLSVVVLLAGTGLLFTRFWRLGRRLLAGLAVFLAAVSVLPLDGMLIGTIENRFPQPQELPSHVDGIVVLGGVFSPGLTAARGQVAANGSIERITAAVELARRFPSARIVFTGGTNAILDTERKEAPIAKTFLDSIGFDTGRVIFEDRSRNTRENAVLSHDLAGVMAGETWLLVTSAAHMPRAVGVFRAAGWPVVPYPVDYATDGSAGSLSFAPGRGLGAVSRALYEWQGLVYYRLRGWTDTLFPGPTDGV